MSGTGGVVIGILLTAGAVYTYSKLTEPSPYDESLKSQKLIDPKGPDVQFVLFTRNSSPLILEAQRYQELNTSGFSPNYPTKIIIHGYWSSVEDNVFSSVKDAYLDTGYYNIIGMNWSPLCQFEYFTAIRRTKIAGQQLGDFINYLSLNGVALKDIHIIGHSLGAHVAAIGADSIKGGRVGRITGLDPAELGYGDIKEELRLDPQDALLVDVIHTFLRFISTSRPWGHIDFYPNSGRYQPGCPDITSFTKSIYCNHGRSYEFFAESIRNPRAFKSKRCTRLEDALSSTCLEESNVYMGQAQTYKNGLYYVKTRGSSPYSMTGDIV